MSILPIDNQDSTSSESSSSQISISCFNHGSSSSYASQSPSFHLPRHSPPSHHNLPAAGNDISSSVYSDSQEVNEKERQSCGKTPNRQNGGKSSQTNLNSQTGVRFSEIQPKPVANLVLPLDSASTSSQGSSGRSTGRKAQVVSGNHLLNFHYDPIPSSRPQPRASPPRRRQKRRPYNKDLFFQANYKFVVLDSGNCELESLDPDKMLNWEDIICLKFCSPDPVQCPICLDYPLCPQITSCGHIFCFPCILQYLGIGEDDHIGKCWKRCPLCFTMISTKDLYTILIEIKKQYSIYDEINFVLLTRQKNSLTTTLKNKEGFNTNEDILDSFSKFTLTSDVELSVRESILDLDSWVARADSGLVDDIEKLPYVCAAMEQLEQRKKFWNENRVSNSNEPDSTLDDFTSMSSAADTKFNASEFASKTKSTACDHAKLFQNPIQNLVINEFLQDQGESSNVYDHKDNVQSMSDGVKGSKNDDSYYFYQAADGQHLILHPFNMKCLLHHYGSYERLPDRIAGKILHLETVTQSEAMRKRYRFLSHLSLSTTFQLCEIDLHEILHAESLSPFMNEIKCRERQRNRLARKELEEKVKAEIAASQFSPLPHYSYDAHSFSMDDFEGSTVSTSSPPILGHRNSFSSVAKLGFAAAHDSPALKAEEILPTLPPKICLPNRRTGLSFADVTSKVKPVEGSSNSGNANELGKKGKRPNRVLLSTAGGRRY